MTRVHSYAEAADLFATARFPDKGKPVNTWARWFRVGDEYELRVHRKPLLRIAPDNTLRFVVSGEQARSFAATLSSSINVVVPFLWQRQGVGVYRVQHMEKVERQRTSWGNLWYSRLGEKDPQLYNGLTFDLSNLQWLNAKPDYTREVDPDKRREWVRAMQTWKRTMKTRVKLGTFDQLVAEMRGGKHRPLYHVWSAKNVDKLYEAIKHNTCDKELMFLLVRGYVRAYGPTPDMADVIEAAVKGNSVGLRKRFGVFKNEEAITQ